MALGVLLTVVQHGDGGDVVEQLARRQHPEVALGINSTVAVAVGEKGGGETNT